MSSDEEIQTNRQPTHMAEKTKINNQSVEDIVADEDVDPNEDVVASPPPPQSAEVLIAHKLTNSQLVRPTQCLHISLC